MYNIYLYVCISLLCNVCIVIVWDPLSNPFPFSKFLLLSSLSKFNVMRPKIFIVLYHWGLAIEHLMWQLLWNRLYGASVSSINWSDYLSIVYDSSDLYFLSVLSTVISYIRYLYLLYSHFNIYLISTIEYYNIVLIW